MVVPHIQPIIKCRIFATAIYKLVKDYDVDSRFLCYFQSNWKSCSFLGRNFKAAKAVAEEKKQVIEEQLTSEEELKNLEEKKKELNLSINSVTDEISKIKEQILKNETELGECIGNFCS